MFKKLFIALALTTSSITMSHAITAEDGQFIFRFRTGIASSQNDNISEKDITAFYVGGVGQAFSEKLPMKPEWEDDRWEVSSGSLPEGITFNAATLTFEGKPGQIMTDYTIALKGYDEANREIADASATFTFYELPESVVPVDLYAHEGKFFFEELKLPNGVTIDGDIKLLSQLPTGVSFNARYFEGTPTESRLEPYPIVAIGYNFIGEAVVAFTGKIRVASGPEFPNIPDDLKTISYSSGNENANHPGFAWWNQAPLPKITRAIKDATQVRYSVEYDVNAPLPGSVAVGGTAFDKLLNGGTSNFYDQGRIRLWATDTDGTKGSSNWFKVGSLGPQALCVPYQASEIMLKGTSGTAFGPYRIPSGADTALKQYSIVQGTLPTNLSLDAQTGVISGVPDKAQQVADVKIDIAFPNNPEKVTVHCGPYAFNIGAGNFDLLVGTYEKEFRKGGSIAVDLKPTGVLSKDAKVTLSSSNLPANVSFDAAALKVSGGPISTPGFYSATFDLDNGHGNTVSKTISFTVRDSLLVNDPPAQVSIRQYDKSDNLFQVTYDANTVVYSGSESLTLDGGPLPSGVMFNAFSGLVSGGTTFGPLPNGAAYGPFTFTLSDSTGEKAVSTAVDVLVTPRADLEPGATLAPTFSLNLQGTQKPFSVTQPPLAIGLLPLSYTLNGPQLPDGLVFNPSTGIISGIPNKVGQVSGFTIRVDEASPDKLFKVSEPFAVTVAEVGPIPDITLGLVEGNAPGKSTNGAPMPVLASADPINRLVVIRDQLQGFETSVKFQSADNLVPGTVYNSANGTFSGSPTAEFNGTVTFNYADGGSRPGKVHVPVKIYPFPSVEPVAASFDLPRLADAQQYTILTKPNNAGFFKGVTWSEAPGSASLPEGLKMVQIGDDFVLSGSTAAEVSETPIIVKVRATSKANNLSTDTSFELNIVPRKPMSLSLPQDALVFKMDEGLTTVTKREVFKPKPSPSGSFVKPTNRSLWSLRDQPSWMTIDADGLIGGTPTQLGDWTVTVVATDAEGIEVTDTVKVRVSLDGYIMMTPGGMSPDPVRVGEAVRFPPEENSVQVLSNIVRPAKDITSSTSKPGSISLDPVTGVQFGYVPSAGSYTWSLQVTDEHDRTMIQNSVRFLLNVVPPLEALAATQNEPAKQFDPANPVMVTFPAALNPIGTVSYSLIGQVPGTFYSKVYPDPKNPEQFYYQKIVDDKVVGTVQANGQSAETVEQTLELDRIIFDTRDRTLKGTPSKTGSFQVSMVAYDDHEKNGYQIEGSIDRTKNNSDVSDPVTIVVEKADDLVAINSVETETLYQFTTQASAETTFTGAAYGKGIKRWVKVSGVLPQNVAAIPANGSLSYAGYPETKGNFSGTVYDAYDYADRVVRTVAIPFSVVDRLKLELVAGPGNPRYMIVNETDAAVRVTAVNSAYGKAIGINNWSVSGTNHLPPGVTYTIDNNGVSFTGTSTLLGKYQGFTITAVDAKGATASMVMTFEVIESPEAIILNVSNITTKVGYPVVMEPPFAETNLSTGNTYGRVRFYSNDLPQIEGISLNGETGYIVGEFESVQKLNFDLFVTDDTDRVTSKPVLVDVVPNLRIIVPASLSGQQGIAFNQTTASDYILGTVTYKKGRGAWPIGIDVDPKTGALFSSYTDPDTNLVSTGVVAQAKAFSGLTIIGEDAFGVYVDTQESNEFTITIEPTSAAPQIADQSKTILGTKNAKIADWKPKAPANWSKYVVVEGKPSQAWNYEGTTFSGSHNLQQYGLNLNSKTGEITGTPTKEFIIRDFQITVTSERGDSDTTAPFWIGVAPEEALGVAPTVKDTYHVRTNETVISEALTPINYIGNVTYDASGQTFLVGWQGDVATGVLQYQKTWPSNIVKSQPAEGYKSFVIARDEFNRTYQFTHTWYFYDALGATMSNYTANLDEDFTNVAVATVTGIYGNATYKAAGLPSGVTMDPLTGRISGELKTNPDDPSAPVHGQEYVVTVTIEDDHVKVPQTITRTFTLKAADGDASAYWEFTKTGSVNMPLTEIEFLDADGNNLAQLYPPKITRWAQSPLLYDGNVTNVAVTVAASGGTTTFTFPKAVKVAQIRLYSTVTDGARLRPNIQKRSPQGTVVPVKVTYSYTYPFQTITLQ